MVTVQNQSVVIVQTSEGERGLNEFGQWVFPDVTAVICAGTTQAVSLRSGAYISIDPGGLVSVTDGPDLVGKSLEGFGLAIGTIGIGMAVKWAFTRVLGAGRIIPPNAFD